MESIDKTTRLALLTLTECNELPDNRTGIPSPDTVEHQAHLKFLVTKIPPLYLEAQILILLGRDIIEAHKVLEQCSSPPRAPFAQCLALGGGIVGKVCLCGAHKPSAATGYKTSTLVDGHPCLMSPCATYVHIKDMYSDTYQLNNARLSFLKQHLCPRVDAENLGGDLVFWHFRDDYKPAPSMEDLVFLKLMDREIHQDSTNSWVAPLHFLVPWKRLPNICQQAAGCLSSLTHMLRECPEMKEHLIDFMSRTFDNGHTEDAPPLQPEQEC